MQRLSRVVAVTLLAPGLFLVWPGAASAQVDARMLRFADVSDTHIVFVYAGDIWVVGKAGGVAQRLSTPTGEEQFPRFSPDGSRIAFQANYDGNDLQRQTGRNDSAPGSECRPAPTWR